MVIANIPDVHPLADRRTDSRTVKTDGNASEIPKRGIILPSGGLDGSCCSKIWRERHFSASGVSNFGKFLKGSSGTVWPI
jgi:hypothetical protein